MSKREITLDVYRDSKGNAREQGRFAPLTVAEIRAWSEPVAETCACVTQDSAGTFYVTVQDETHADSIKRLRGIECAVGERVALDCSCKRDRHTGVRYVDQTPSHVWFHTINGDVRQAKVNGRVRTWKRDKTRVELPVKYGLYEYATFDSNDIEAGRVLRRIQ